MTLRFLAALFFLALAMPASADQQFFKCNVNKKPNEWIPQILIFSLEKGKKTSLLSDDVTLSVVGGPVTATVGGSQNRVSLRWKVKTDNIERLPLGAMGYSAVFNRKTGRIIMTAIPLGYPVDFKGSGKCAAISTAETKKIEKMLKSARVAKAVGKVNPKTIKLACKIVRKTKFKLATPDTINLVLDDRILTISDNVMKQAGVKSVKAKIDRSAKGSFFFSWSLAGIPKNLKPKTGKRLASSTVNYRARLNLNSGKISVTSSFVGGVGSAINMKGVGACKIAK